MYYINSVNIALRMLAMPPPDPQQPPGQDELERRLPGYRRIVIPRELTLIELLVRIYLSRIPFLAPKASSIPKIFSPKEKRTLALFTCRKRAVA